MGAMWNTRYELIEVSSDTINREMRIAGPMSGIPEVLQGLWWMDGNPLPDEVISLGRSIWNQDTRSTGIEVYGERIWSWHASIWGRSAYALAYRSRLVYELAFDEKLCVGTITPVMRVLGRRVRVPESLVRLTMHLEYDGVWRRESRLFGLFHHAYRLRRIVRGDGAREEAFADYVRSAPARSLLAVREAAEQTS